MSRQRIPLWAKWVYTAFMAVLVPVYWYHYGPTNFLYFCDVALFLTLVAMWWESKLLASMCAVGILLPQLLWVADFAGCCVGQPLTGMTNYMFHEHKPLYLRGLSLFHGWIPFLLIYLVLALGYDRRAFAAWTVLAWVLLAVGYFLLPAPPAPPSNPNLPVNVNYVFGMNDELPQSWMHPLLWLGVLMVGLPVALYLPTHVLLMGMMRWWKREVKC
ncbi:MAG: hypothetical protein U0796_21770 [Gemmatales bacterium]